MRTALTFVGALLLSLILANMVAIPLAIQFKAREEFIAVMFALGILAVAAIAVFSIVFVASDLVKSIDLTAVVLAALTVGLIAGLLGYAIVVGGTQSLTDYDIYLAIEFLVPALVTILIQWWLVRRCKARVIPRGAF